MKKVLVMGGNQFLGKRVCEILLEKKYEVFAINRGNRENLKGINFLKCDRNNEEELRKITENLKVDYIVDISAYTGKQVDILQVVLLFIIILKVIQYKKKVQKEKMKFGVNMLKINI